MTCCRGCDQLRNNDPDGMVLTCALTGQRCFIDDLPWTTMPGCPKRKSMKALTLWQPWASLAALGLKHETRSWGTSYRGPIAIHAAARKPETKCIPASTVYRMIEALRPITEPLAKTAMYLPLELLPRGCIVGTGILAGCYKILRVHIPPTPPAEYCVDVEDGGRCHELWITADDLRFGDWTPGRYAWALADMTTLPKPIPAKGKQGLWEWEQS